MGHRKFTFLITLFAAWAAANAAHAGIIPGSTYDVAALGGFPGAIAGVQTVTFDGKAELINGGKLTINERAIDVTPQKQWLEFTLQTVDGKAIATPDIWTVNLKNLQMGSNATFDAVPGQSVYMYFTINGTPVTTGNPFQTTPNSTIAAHPVDPNTNVFYFNNTANNGDFNETTSQFFARVLQPMIHNGVDFSKVNGVVFGVAYTTAALIPEPSTSVMLLLGGVGLAMAGIRRARGPGRRRST
ncbi:MAG: PEP-CTERM sorting domain-containing protein [Pirellulales bacterium]